MKRSKITNIKLASKFSFLSYILSDNAQVSLADKNFSAYLRSRFIIFESTHRFVSASRRLPLSHQQKHTTEEWVPVGPPWLICHTNFHCVNALYFVGVPRPQSVESLQWWTTPSRRRQLAVQQTELNRSEELKVTSGVIVFASSWYPDTRTGFPNRHWQRKGVGTERAERA